MNMIFKLKLANEPNEILVYTCQKEPYHTIVLGKGTYLGSSTMHLGGGRKGNISIGNYTSIANDCLFLMGMNHDYSSVSTYPFEDIIQDRGATNHYVNSNHYQIIIGHDIWIGQHVTIMGGVKIGNGAVIAAHSVVTHDVPPYAIVGGIPARIIKYRFPADIIKKIQAIKWWYWDIETITKNLDKMKSPQIFAEEYYKGSINKHPPIILKELKRLGNIIFFLADLDNNDGIYNDVIKQYSTFIKKYPDYILLVGVDNKYQQTGENALEESYIDGNKVYIYYYDTDQACDEVLSVASFIVSNGEKTFMKYYDYATDYNVKILNGFDADIFQSLKTERTKEDQPILTIGIPTYNRLKYLKKCLSYICQAVGNDKRVKILVSDNASKTEVKEFMESLCTRYSNLIYVRQEKNIGATNNFEYIFKSSTGKYTWLVGDDDYFIPDTIKNIVELLAKGIDVSILALLSANENYHHYIKEGIDSYIIDISFFSTSISSFIAKTSLLNIDEFNHNNYDDFFKTCSITQVALQLEVLRKQNKYALFRGPLFMPNHGESAFITPEQHKKMGYTCGLPDLGTVFIHQFITILKKYGLSDNAISINKAKIYDGFLLTWCTLASKQCIRWRANHVLEWYDIYYKNESYYASGRKQLENILNGIDPNLKGYDTDNIDNTAEIDRLLASSSGWI